MKPLTCLMNRSHLPNPPEIGLSGDGGGGTIGLLEVEEKAQTIDLFEGDIAPQVTVGEIQVLGGFG